ncbi:hypothetical protein ACH5RR_027869 [Cinchona calisaya]|uniref:Uncharacterized protein n=1 Tax=Cinchona calisaya TaxID=153742 RepID=A0ABD2YM67_9GENT
MTSIINSKPPSISIFPGANLKPHFTSTKLLWLSKSSKSEAANSGFMHIHKQDRLHALPTRVASATLFLAATSPPNPGDLSVLFQTSAVMLLMYWIANFIVPELALKDLQGDETNEERKQEEENLSDNQPGRRTSGSGQKRGFDSTKQ